MLDVRGRTIRTSAFKDPVIYGIDDKVEFRTDGMDIQSTKSEIQVNYFELPPVMRDEDQVFLGESGEICGEVVEIARTSFVVKITHGGTLEANK